MLGTAAETSVGNDSHAVSAELGEKNGFLVYNVMVIDPSMNFSKVVVDPGNGEVILSEQISKEEHMRMHGMDKQGMMGPGMMTGGPGKMMRMGPPGGMMMGESPGGMVIRNVNMKKTSIFFYSNKDWSFTYTIVGKYIPSYVDWLKQGSIQHRFIIKHWLLYSYFLGRPMM